jgi:lipoprotein-anchoring transpeptidase ErfK/SrfK
MFKIIGLITVAALVSCAVVPGSTALAEPLALASTNYRASAIFEPVMRGQPTVQRPSEDSQASPDLPARLRRQIVDFPTGEASGTIIIDTPNTYLYYVLGTGKAIRYGIGVGREGFTWSGVQSIARKAEWPDWIPPAEMVARQPYLPRFMAGGLGNPLGARALYLGGTIYRIHGTNQPSTIGGQVSSGCIRMVNEDVIDLYGRVDVGTRVVVLPAESHRIPDRSAQIRSTATTVSIASNRSRASVVH